MIDDSNYVELVKKAQQGDKYSLDLLAEGASAHLHECVKRITLKEDLSRDIVQESILEMFKVFGKLKRPERFWEWLEGIAFNKMRNHYGRQWRRREISLSGMAYEAAREGGSDGLADMVTAEFKEIVVKSMHRLPPRHRAILSLRCYKGMRYGQIAKLMACSELGAQALFYRAKKSLAKELSRNGLSKGTLLTALIVFGKLTAADQAAAASISVTAATTKVGLVAGAARVLGGQTAILSLTTAGVLAIGGVIATSGPEKTAGVATTGDRLGSIGPVVAGAVPPGREASGEYWHYFPEGPGGPVMMQQTSEGTRYWLQDEEANYYHRGNAVCIENQRVWHRSLRVWRLPTDSPELSDFISKVEGVSVRMERIASGGRGLLVVAEPKARAANSINWVTRSQTVLQEDYFQCDWPRGIQIIDNRDAMHKRGWTYFAVEGQIDGRNVIGQGRIPFSYVANSISSPWVRLRIDGEEFVSESFVGLSRPWMGLHTIDTVRRDAASEGVWFEATYKGGGSEANVVLTRGGDRLVYTIDMAKDVVRRIEVFSDDGAGGYKLQGELRLSYWQSVEGLGADYRAPRAREYGRGRKKWSIMWPTELVDIN